MRQQLDAFSRLVDANLFILQIPSAEDAAIILGTLYPFDLDGLGYEARIYKLTPKHVALSQAAAIAGTSGWGIDDVTVNSGGSLELSRDEDFSLKIWAALPCEIQLKRDFFSVHPSLRDNGAPRALHALLTSSAVSWQTLTVTKCPELI